jgi:hypothetical protein
MSAPNFQQFFPCLPDYMSWEEWTGNVIIYYGQKNIEFSPEENWKDGAMNIVLSETFGSYPVPNPNTYEAWQDWAMAFTEIVNGPSR